MSHVLFVFVEAQIWSQNVNCNSQAKGKDDGKDKSKDDGKDKSKDKSKDKDGKPRTISPWQQREIEFQARQQKGKDKGKDDSKGYEGYIIIHVEPFVDSDENIW